MTADSNPQDLDTRVDGLRIVLAMVLNMMPDHGIVRDRLRLLEETARRQNIEVWDDRRTSRISRTV